MLYYHDFLRDGVELLVKGSKIFLLSNKKGILNFDFLLLSHISIRPPYHHKSNIIVFFLSENKRKQIEMQQY